MQRNAKMFRFIDISISDTYYKSIFDCIALILKYCRYGGTLQKKWGKVPHEFHITEMIRIILST